MTKQKEKYLETEIKFSYIPGPGILLGYLPNDKVYDYLEKLKNSVSAHDKCTYYDFKLLTYPRTMGCDQTLTISANPYIVKPLCKIRTLDGCLRKIRTGECKNQFIVEAIEYLQKNQTNEQR